MIISASIIFKNMKNTNALFINTTQFVFFLILEKDAILAAFESHQLIIFFDSEKKCQKIQALSAGSSQMKLIYTQWNEKLFDELDLRQEDRHHISHCFICLLWSSNNYSQFCFASSLPAKYTP